MFDNSANPVPPTPPIQPTNSTHSQSTTNNPAPFNPSNGDPLAAWRKFLPGASDKQLQEFQAGMLKVLANQIAQQQKIFKQNMARNRAMVEGNG